MADLALTTPDDYISYYFTQLQNELQVYDVQANKFGFLGYFTNILGYSNFDTKSYYDSLYKEAFVATAQEDANLYVHASTYGYMPGFAQAANAVGNFIFDFADLPAIPNNMYKREVYFGSTNSLVQFDINGFVFTSSAQYKFVQESSGQYYAVVFTQDGRIIQVPSSSSKIIVPMYDVYQYDVKTFTIAELDSYPFGTYLPVQFTVTQPYIYQLSVDVKNPTDANYSSYDIRRVKYFEQPFSKVVFFKNVSDTKFELSFGSGVRGAWVPNASAKVTVKFTQANKGNLNLNTTTFTRDSNLPSYQITSQSYVYVVNFSYVNGTSVASDQQYLESKYVAVDFQYSENGTVPNDGEQLRQEVVNYIQTRDNMINQKDFYNVTNKYINDFKFLFKKSNVMDNTFYLCRTFRDRYQRIVPSLNKTIKVIDINTAPQQPSYTTSNLPDSTLDDKYMYYIVADNKFGSTIHSQELTVDLTSLNMNTIELSWPSVDGATSYKIFRKDMSNNIICWTVDNKNSIFTICDANYEWTLSSQGVNEYYLANPLNILPAEVIESGYPITSGVVGNLKVSQWAYADNDNLGYQTVYVRLSDNESPSTHTSDYLKVNADIIQFIDTGDTSSAVPSALENGILNSEIWWPTFKEELDNIFSISDVNNFTWTLSTAGTNEYYLRSLANTNPNLILPNDIRENNKIIINSQVGHLNQSQWAYGDNDNLGYNTIYVRLIDDTSPATHDVNYLKANILNTKNFISPFLYKYNDLMNWYDAYFVYKFILAHFSSFTLQEQYYTPPSIYLNVVYDFKNKKSIIYIKSYQNIENLKFVLNVDELSLYGEEFTNIDKNTFAWEYTVGNGRFDNAIQLSFEVFDKVTGASKFQAVTNKIQQVYSIQDQLRLLMFQKFSSKYILNIPCIDLDTFNSDEQYYLQRLYDFIVGFSFKENRMQTDNVQFRLMNTFCMEQDYLKRITKQQYDTYNMIFPLNIALKVKVDQLYVTRVGINLSDLREQILSAVSNYLQTFETGFNLKYYNSQIADIIHNIGIYILSVDVSVTDSSINPNMITDGIELLPETDLMQSLTINKLQTVKYTPHYFSWDVDNIDLKITM